MMLQVKFDVETCSAAASSLSLGICFDSESSSDQLDVIVHGGALEVLEGGLINKDPSPVALDHVRSGRETQ